MAQNLMSDKVTVADIAKALGLSRNTVSKALNGGENISEDTRKRVIEQAITMNYKMLGEARYCPELSVRRNILIVCRDRQLTDSLFGQLILELKQLVMARGAVMTLQFMSPEEVAGGVIPENLPSSDGIIGLEILDKDYMSMLIRQGKPCVFFDGGRCMEETEKPYDLVLQDENGLYRLICGLIDEGVKSLGFVGDPEHCLGFWNRYCCFALALHQHGLSDDYSLLFHEPENRDFTGVIERHLKENPLPEVFVCVNTFIENSLMRALENLSIRIPEQVQVVTFGVGAKPGQKVLAAVTASQKSVASVLVMLLFDRMTAPDTEFRRVMTESRIEWGSGAPFSSQRFCQNQK